MEPTEVSTFRALPPSSSKTTLRMMEWRPRGRPFKLHCYHCRRNVVVRVPLCSRICWLYDEHHMERDLCSKVCAGVYLTENNCSLKGASKERMFGWFAELRWLMQGWLRFPLVGEIQVKHQQQRWWHLQSRRRHRRLYHQHVYDLHHPDNSPWKECLILDCFVGRVYFFREPDQPGVWSVLVRKKNGFHEVLGAIRQSGLFIG